MFNIDAFIEKKISKFSLTVLTDWVIFNTLDFLIFVWCNWSLTHNCELKASGSVQIKVALKLVTFLKL